MLWTDPWLLTLIFQKLKPRGFCHNATYYAIKVWTCTAHLCYTADVGHSIWENDQLGESPSSPSAFFLVLLVMNSFRFNISLYFIFLTLFLLHFLTWRAAEGAEVRILQPLSWLIRRYRCRNKGRHMHVHTPMQEALAAGQSLRNSVKCVLKFAVFYYQCIDFKCSRDFFPSRLQSAQDVTSFLLSSSPCPSS